ncbi:unnamed protein product [Pleuronectes platessa]|uniref:Uncharacterized protein n=1 Tax=Pleuronectes platessa TaxID=8262 RepID=A0A9N7YWX3_PLEPL|nr:unnamed protein product [Pleuronectes platessa]
MSFCCHNTTNTPPGLFHESLPFTPPHRQAQLLRSSKAPRVVLRSAAGVGVRLISSPIGWRRQLGTADAWMVDPPAQMRSPQRESLAADCGRKTHCGEGARMPLYDLAPGHPVDFRSRVAMVDH